MTNAGTFGKLKERESDQHMTGLARLKSVCAVVVTYNPGPTLNENLEAIFSQVGQVVVVDNGSSTETQGCLAELKGREQCEIIFNQQNLGLATALNRGVKYALQNGFDWVGTFDQDSLVSEGFFSAMLKTYQECPEPEHIGLVSPTYLESQSGTPIRIRRGRDGAVLATMTSGSLIPATVVRKIGFFDENLFIDAVDKEFCLRIRRNGMAITQSPAVLWHSLGRITYHHVFGCRFGTTNHSAGRRYYMARNGVHVLINYLSDWPWVWREIVWMLQDAIKVGLAEDHKWAKFRAMANGVADGLLGKMGKRVDF